jgi:hypothetical protein
LPLQVVERRSISISTPLYNRQRAVGEVLPARWKSVALGYAVLTDHSVDDGKTPTDGQNMKC